MESREYLLNELKTIEAWEQDQKGLWFWERMLRLPFKLLDKVTPKFIHEKVGQLLDELGSYLHTGGQYLVNEKTVFRYMSKKTGKNIIQYADLEAVPLEVTKRASHELSEKRKKAATFQGASTGIGGIFTLAIDVPAVLAISLKTLQEIAMIHGYDPKEKNERVFIIKCLQFSTADIVGKEAILNELSEYSQGNKSTREAISQLQGWREVTMTFTESFGWKKLFQMVPVAGIIFGAFANRQMIKDLAETGTMLYQKRRILERLNETSSSDHLGEQGS